MKRRFIYHKAEGQNVILLAGILVLLVGMAALAVDLGVTYAEQRNIVRGANAASLAGMNRLISGGRDVDVARAIYESLRSNGI
ncbi:MAG: Tad domain-containing protein, partial [Anaerolineae bacterium]|nr:Tad domain-containing protein [Anaerolineae bacterium]